MAICKTTPFQELNLERIKLAKRIRKKSTDSFQKGHSLCNSLIFPVREEGKFDKMVDHRLWAPLVKVSSKYLPVNAGDSRKGVGSLGCKDPPRGGHENPFLPGNDGQTALKGYSPQDCRVRYN